MSDESGLGLLTHLFLVGEDTHNPTFAQVLKDALKLLLPAAEVENIEIELSGQNSRYSHIKAYSPLYIAARGETEYARQAQEAPAGCIEPP